MPSLDAFFSIGGTSAAVDSCSPVKLPVKLAQKSLKPKATKSTKAKVSDKSPSPVKSNKNR